MEKSNKNTSQLVMTIVGITLCVILVPILIVNVTLIIKGAADQSSREQGIYDPEKVPSFFNIAPLIVLSGSMENSEGTGIDNGDLIFVDTTFSFEELEAGDIITFYRGSDIITHRIVGMVQNADNTYTFTTRGDNNNTDDTEPVESANVIGIYKSRLKGLGSFALFLQKPLGMLCFVGIPLCAFIMYDVVRRLLYAKKEKSKTEELEKELEELRKLQHEANGNSAFAQDKPLNDEPATKDDLTDSQTKENKED